jgi:hypothetical protein
MVAKSPHPKQWSVHLQANRYCLPPRRLQRLRRGGRSERRPQLPSTRFLVRDGPPTTHHVEGTPSRTARRRVFPTLAQRPAHSPTRRQHLRSRDAHQTNHTVTRHDVRAAPPMVATRHQRHYTAYTSLLLTPPSRPLWLILFNPS